MFAVITEKSIEWIPEITYSITLHTTFEEAKSHFEAVSGEELQEYEDINVKGSYAPSNWKKAGYFGLSERYIFVPDKLIQDTTVMPKQMSIDYLSNERRASNG